MNLIDLPLEIIQDCLSLLNDKDLVSAMIASPYLTLPPSHILKRKWLSMASGGTIDKLARIGDLEGVKYLISKGYTYTTNAFGGACINNHIEVVKYLYENVPHSVDKPLYSQSILLTAFYYGHLNIVMYLHEVGMKIDPYHIDNSISMNHFEIVKYFHSIGMRGTINGIDKSNNKDIFNYLHSFGYYKFTSQLMYITACKGNLELLKYLSICISNFDEFRIIAIIRASEFEQLEVIKFLINKYIDPTTNCLNIDVNMLEQACINACHSGKLNVIIYLFEIGMKCTQNIVNSNCNGYIRGIMEINILKYLHSITDNFKEFIPEALELATTNRRIIIIDYLKSI